MMLLSYLMTDEKIKNTKPKDREHYVNNADFLKEMKVYIKAVNKAKKEKTPLPKISDFIGQCILSIANKLANKPNFMNYPFREEMISDGIENCLMYINNFNPRKSNNPFAYFTQIIYFAFVRRIQKEKKHLYTKYRIIEESMLGDFPDEIKAPSQYGSEHSDQYMHEFIENFDKSRKEKKIKNKKRKEKANLETILNSVKPK